MSNRKFLSEVSSIVSQFVERHTIGQTGSKHLKVQIYSGQSCKTVFFSGTPGDHRAILNFKTKVKKAAGELRAAA